MFSPLIKEFKIAISLFFFLTLLTGIVYPLILTGIAQIIFPKQANGSLIKQHNQIVGSSLIGQAYGDLGYFWGRLSATSPFPYNGKSSSGSNMGPSNPAYLALIHERVQAFHRLDPDNPELVPVDLVTASGSGLDSEISPQAAFYQVHRIAKARQLDESQINNLIRQHIIKRTLGFIGEPRINVLQLNRSLDTLRNSHGKNSSQP